MVEHRKTAKDYWNETLPALIFGGTIFVVLREKTTQNASPFDQTRIEGEPKGCQTKDLRAFVDKALALRHSVDREFLGPVDRDKRPYQVD